jgi:hypothetical protein
MGRENKIFLKYDNNKVFWPKKAYIQCTDTRFRFLNLDFFGKPGVLVAHSCPPFTLLWSHMSDLLIVSHVCALLLILILVLILILYLKYLKFKIK